MYYLIASMSQESRLSLAGSSAQGLTKLQSGVGQGAFSSGGLNGEEPTSKFIPVVGKNHFLAAIELMWFASSRPAREHL